MNLIEKLNTKAPAQPVQREGAPEEMASIAGGLGLERQAKLNRADALQFLKKASPLELAGKMLAPEHEIKGRKVKALKDCAGICFSFTLVWKKAADKNILIGKRRIINTTREVQTEMRALLLKDYPHKLPYGALLRMQKVSGVFEEAYILSQKLTGSRIIFGAIGDEFYEVYCWSEKQ